MWEWTKALLVLWLVLGLFTCIKPIEVDLPDLDRGIAISATLSTQKSMQEVRMFRLAPFTTSGLNYPIQKAEVWITDNLGQRQDFREDPTRAGIYSPTNLDYVGEIGKTYVLHVNTADQQKYESIPQTIREVPPIKKVYSEEIIVDDPLIGIAVNGFNVLLDLDDPPSKGDYYRWDWVNYEQLGYCAQFDGVTFGLNYGTLVGVACCRPCWDIHRCYVNCANVFSDALINGNTITRHPISRIPYCSTDYYIEIQQRSISKEAYTYWQTVDQLSTNNGSIFDTAPAIVHGNLKCLSDPEQTVYGLFEVFDLTEGGYFISRANISKRGVFTCAQLPLPSNSTNCAECVESRFRTRIKPRFWTK